MEDSPRGELMVGPDNLHFLDDMDSYLEDISSCLTVSRMVSDTVIKGMVNDVSEEVAERFAVKEAEVAVLREKLRLYESGVVKVGELSGVQREEECLGKLRVEAENQFRFLEKKIGDVKGCVNCGKSLCSELQGQSGRVGSEWVEVDESLSSLRNILKAVFVQVDNVVCLSKQSVWEWEQEKEFRDDIEAFVIQDAIRSLVEESEARFREQRGQLYGARSTKIQELSSLLHELDSISTSFMCPEMGHMFSFEGGEECNNAKRKDRLHRKLSIPKTFTDACAKDEEYKKAISETTEYGHMKHKSKEEIISYFRSEISNMRRDHDTNVQEITEEFFSLRREFLKERGPASLRKDKDFESLRKKIPEVIVKLEDILTKNEKLPVAYENTEIVCSLKGRIDALVSENHQLKDLIVSKTKEVKCLSSQVSSATDKMSRHSLTEANLLNLIRKLKSDMEDTQFEVSVREDIFNCILREMIAGSVCEKEDSDMEFKSMLEIYEIIFKEFVKDGEAAIKLDIEDSDMESIVMQEISGIIFKEAAKDVISALSLAMKKEVHSFTVLIEEERKLALKMSSTLMEEKKQSNQISQELKMLRDKASQQERLISEHFQKSNSINSKLEEAEVEKHKLDQKLKLVTEDLKEADQERRVLHEIAQKNEKALSLLKAKEVGYRKQIESITVSVHKLFKASADFEGQTVKTIERNSNRLKLLKSQCGPLVQKATLFWRMKAAYKQRLEKRYSDLQKAETEVDLLGDEVDALLSLLEKIYIALDHYSPILELYPGITEILRLIKRELSGETVKSV